MRLRGKKTIFEICQVTKPQCNIFSYFGSVGMDAHPLNHQLNEIVETSNSEHNIGNREKEGTKLTVGNLGKVALLTTKPS